VAKLFISYRRDDAAVVAGRICDRLQAHFGRSSVFMDVDSIPYGTDFRKHLTDAVTQCDVLLAVIGPDWLKVQADGRPRLAEPNDFVRIEIKVALEKGIRIVPVLIGQTTMPLESQLPEELKGFAYLQAAQVHPDKDFHLYMDRVVRKLDELLARSGTAAVPAAANQPSVVKRAAAGAQGTVATANLDALVKSVQITMAYNSTDNRGQIFAKLKIVLSSVSAVFNYLEDLVRRSDEDLVEKATVVLIKHCRDPVEHVLSQAQHVLQVSANPGVRRAMVKELSVLLKAHQSSWDPQLQAQLLEAIEFVAEYDSVHLVRLAAIEAVAQLAREDGTDFLVSIIRNKKGAGETTPDWSHAVSTLAKSGDAYAAQALAKLCAELPTEFAVLQSIVYWVKCSIYRFEQMPRDIKTGLGEGAKAVLRGYEAISNPPFAEAAITVVICFAPEEATDVILTLLESDDPRKRNAVCFSFGAVEAQEQKKRYFRQLRQHKHATKTVIESLKKVAADPDSNDQLKKCASTVINFLQTA
jgi:hypothetical protein